MKHGRLLLVAMVLWALLALGSGSLNPVRSLAGLLSEVDDLTGARRLTRSTLDGNGNVVESMDELLSQAAEVAGGPVGETEYAVARMLRSERTRGLRGGNDGEGAAIVWVCLNDANAHNGGSVLQALTGGRGFGEQAGRKYSTARDPYDRDLELVRSIFAGEVGDPTGGRTHFMHRDGFESEAAYQAAVVKWTGYGWKNSGLDFGTSLEVWT